MTVRRRGGRLRAPCGVVIPQMGSSPRYKGAMRYALPILLVLAPAACSILAKSPALQAPLQDRLAKAELTDIEDAAKTCLSAEGWRPDDVGSIAEGSTVVKAKNPQKEIVAVYIHSAEVTPRVTGGPSYGDPFWGCLGHQLEGGKSAAPAEAASGEAPPVSGE